MKTIILATDFTPTAFNAAVYAVNMAKTINANILLFNVYEVLPNYGEMIFDVDIEALKTTARTEIQKLKKILLNQPGINFNIATEITIGVFKCLAANGTKKEAAKYPTIFPASNKRKAEAYTPAW